MLVWFCFFVVGSWGLDNVCFGSVKLVWEKFFDLLVSFADLIVDVDILVVCFWACDPATEGSHFFGGKLSLMKGLGQHWFLLFYSWINFEVFFGSLNQPLLPSIKHPFQLIFPNYLTNSRSINSTYRTPPTMKRRRNQRSWPFPRGNIDIDWH